MPSNHEQFQQALLNNNLDLLDSFMSEMDESVPHQDLGPSLLREALTLKDTVSDETLFFLLQYPLIHRAITQFLEDGRHALHFAAETNHWKALVLFSKYIINSDEINVPTKKAYTLKISNTKDVSSFTPIMLAAIHKNMEAIHTLFALYKQQLDIKKHQDTKKHHAHHYLTADKYSHLKLESMTRSEPHQIILQRCQELKQKHEQWMAEQTDPTDHESIRTEASSSISMRCEITHRDSLIPEPDALTCSQIHLDALQAKESLPKFKETFNQAMNDFLKTIQGAHPGYLTLCETFVGQQRKNLETQKDEPSPIEAHAFITNIKTEAMEQFKMHHQVLRIFLDCLMIATIPLGLGIAFAGLKHLTTGYSFFYLNHPDLGQEFSDLLFPSPNFSSAQ